MMINLRKLLGRTQDKSTLNASTQRVSDPKRVVALSELRTRVSDVYDRLQNENLTKEDIIEWADAKLPDCSGAVHRFYSDAKRYDKHFLGYRTSYMPFKIFGEESVTLDVGADWGYSVMAKRHCGCRAKIVSIDPSPYHRKSLRYLRALEGSRYDFLNFAIGASEENLVFYTPVLNRKPITGLTSTGKSLNGEAIDHIINELLRYGDVASSAHSSKSQFGLLRFVAKSLTLDQIFNLVDVDPKHIQAIKMDIEGYEGPVIESIAPFLGAQSPLLMIEGANRDPLVRSTLASLGYFHCELQGGQLVAKLDVSVAQDGYWLHPTRVQDYCTRGLQIPEVPDDKAIWSQLAFDA